MDIEFHYYMMYLIAAKAGFGYDNACKIAYVSQYVDDNTMKFEIDKGKETAYHNYISQTMNILKPKRNLFRIYPVFHFIPGDPTNTTAFRKDGKMHWMNTTPNSTNANKIFHAALKTENLYRIGISCHSYADSWAHQNFVGYFDTFNAMKEPLSQVTPDIGHADAQHNPDRPGFIWKDHRLLDECRNNKKMFLDAAKHIFFKLLNFTDSKISKKSLRIKSEELLTDLCDAIGDQDQTNKNRGKRIDRYRELSTRNDYGAGEIPKYNKNKWFKTAVKEKIRGLRNRSDIVLAQLDPVKDKYYWSDRQDYKNTDWYRFQEAIKEQQKTSLDILLASNLMGLDLPKF